MMPPRPSGVTVKSGYRMFFNDETAQAVSLQGFAVCHEVGNSLEI